MFDSKKISDLVSETYGIICLEVKALQGYKSKNFRLKEASLEKEYVLRMTRALDLTAQFDEIKNMQLYLHSCGFKVTHPIKTVNEEYNVMKYVVDDAGKSDKWYIELSPFISGKTIFETNPTGEKLIEIAKDIGYFGGLVDKALLTLSGKQKQQTFNIISKQSKTFVYHTANFYELKKFIDMVKDDKLNYIISECLEKFKEKVHPLIPELRHSIVHGDTSDTNIVLTTKYSSHDDEEVLSIKERLGLLDFELVHYGAVVFDFTVSLAYLMSYAEEIKTAMQIAGNLLSGYEKALPLTRKERKVLFWGILARLCSSYAMSFHNIAENPENEAYLSAQASKCPNIIKLLWEKGEDAFMEEILAIAANGS